MSDFTATRCGFHFPNNFINHVDIIPAVGSITTSGLCGGMSFAALDYYHASLPVPTHVAADFPASGGVPPDPSRLRNYIFKRQLDTFNPGINPSAHKFITQALPIGRTCYQVTVQDEWPLITAALDGGQPVPLGLIARSIDPTQCHQIVATDYTASPKKIQIYDCNNPDTPATLLLDDSAQMVKESTGDNWAGLFLEQYQQANPTYLDLRLSQGISTNPSGTATVGDIVEAGFTVRNDGEARAHLLSLDASVIGPNGEDLDSLFTSDETAADLASGATQSYLAQAGSFGTNAGDPGIYEVVAWYQSRQGEWFPVPTGAPGTSSSTTVDAF
jgi:hypothetical protein